MKKPGFIRIFKKSVATVLLAAVLMSDSAITVLAEPVDAEGAGQAQEGIEDIQVELNDTGDTQPQETAGTIDGTGIVQEGEPQETAGTESEAGDEAIFSEDEALLNTGEVEPKDGAIEYSEGDVITIDLGEFSGEEARGEASNGANRFNNFNNNSRTDYYHRFYNQLKDKNPYAETVYKYFEKNIEKFKMYDSSKEATDGYKTYLLKDAYKKDYGTDNQLRSSAEKAFFYGAAAYIWDNPRDTFWLAAGNITVKAGASFSSTDSITYLKDLWIEFAPSGVSKESGAFVSAPYTNDDGTTNISEITSDAEKMKKNVSTIVSAVNAATSAGTDQDGDEDFDLRDKVIIISDYLTKYNYYNPYLHKVDDYKIEKAWCAASALNWDESKEWLNKEDKGETGSKESPVCQGYSYAFKMICDELGIPCTVGSGDGHMWNYVQTEDGNWYAIDATWNDGCQYVPVVNENQEEVDHYGWHEYDYRYAAPQGSTLMTGDEITEYQKGLTDDALYDSAHEYIMVGQNTTNHAGKGFVNSGHHDNASFWKAGYGLDRPILSTTSYESDVEHTTGIRGPKLADLTAASEGDVVKVSFKTDKAGKYYAVLRKSIEETAPTIYEVQNLITDVDGGSASGSVTIAATDTLDDNGRKTVTFTMGEGTAAGIYNLYLIQLTPEEYISNMLSVTGIDYAVALNSITIRDIPATDSHTLGEENTLKLGSGLVLNYAVDPKGYKIYTYGNESIADDGDIIVKLTSSDSSIIKINSQNNSIWAYSTGTATITADAYIKKNKDIADAHRTATIDVTVKMPTNELVDMYGRKYISFDGVSNYQGWATYKSGKWSDVKDEEGKIPVNDGTWYRFMKAGDYIDDTSEAGKTPVLENQYGSMATGEIWIDGKLYRFSSDGKYQGQWLRMKSLDFIKPTSGGDIQVVITEQSIARGEKYKATVTYVGELNPPTITVVPSADINENKNITISASDPTKVSFSDIKYKKTTGYFGESIYEATFDIIALAVTDADDPVVVTVKSGDADNKYRPAGCLKVNVTEPLGWVKLGQDTYYNILDVDGKTVKKYVGWLKYAGGECVSMESAPSNPDNDTIVYYYFDSEGKMATGTLLIGDSYYAFDADGAFICKIEKSGFVTIDGKTYYYKGNGGTPEQAKNGIIDFEGRKYYFDENGVMVENDWIVLTEGEGDDSVTKCYYANGSGVLVRGFQSIKSQEYYFDNDCIMQTGIVSVDGKEYYLNMSADDIVGGLGSMQFGYFGGKSADGTKDLNYYSNPATGANPGILQKGLVKIDGVNHYFGSQNPGDDIYAKYAENESFSEGWVIDGDDTYYINSNGVSLKGWQTLSRDGVSNRYYFEPDGKMCTGLSKIGSSYYFFNDAAATDAKAGIMMKGRVLTAVGEDADDTSDDEYMFFNGSGVRVTGWQKDTNQDNATYNTWDYYDVSSYVSLGAEVVIPGDNWYSITIGSADHSNTYYYYFKNNTTKLTNWQTITGSVTGKYYFDTTNDAILNGSMYTGFRKVGSNYYYFREDNGHLGIMLTGNGVVAVPDPEGTHVNPDDPTSPVLTRNYYVNTSGVLQLGWQQIDGKWRYFDRAYGYEVDGAEFGQDGWVVIDGKTYYFKNGTTMATGFLTIDNKNYYFSQNNNDGSLGQLQTGFFIVSGNTYYASVDEADYGVIQSGYIELSDGIGTDSKHYYLNDKFILQYGWQKVNGTWKYFATKAESDIFENAVSLGEEVNTDTTSTGNWFKKTIADNDTYYYFNNNTTMVKGWQTIDGRKYYFDAAGVLLTADYTVGSGYYHGFTTAEGGVVAAYGTTLGMTFINSWSTDGMKYYGSNGAMLTGWQAIADAAGVKNTYYFENNKASEHYGEKYIGRRNIGTSTNIYVFDKDGHRLTGYVNLPAGEGITADDAGNYYLNGSGVAYTGWQKIRIDGSDVWKYFSKVDGREALTDTDTDWVTIEYSDESIHTYYMIDGKKMATGFQTIGGKKYFFENNAKSTTHDYGQMYEDEWFLVGSNKYYAGSDGALCTGGENTVGTDTYYFDNNGVVKTGWILTGADGIERFYYNDKVNKESYEYGVKISSGYVGNGLYYVDDAAAVGGKRYYRFSGNTMQKGWQTIDGKKYCFGTDGAMLTGLFKYSNNWYYTNDDGSVYTGFKVVTADGVTETYYFNGNGQRLYGWQKIDGKQYYFDKTTKGTDGILTGAMVTGRVKIGNDYYIFAQDGSRLDNGFYEDNGSIYYVNGSGVVLKGWQTIKTPEGSNKYYFDYTGAMATGLWNIGGSIYYLQEERQVAAGMIYPVGAMRKGYLTIGDSNYIFNSSSGAAMTGWQKVSDSSAYKWGYFAAAKDVAEHKAVLGKEYTDSSVVEMGWTTVSFPDGKNAKYYLNTNGVLKGWQTIKDSLGVSRRYYLDPATGEMWIGSQKIGSNWYFLNDGTDEGLSEYQDGEMIHGAWHSDSEGFMYYNANGVRVSGWQNITLADNKSHKIYFDTATGYMKTGFFQVGKDTFYSCEITGPIDIGGKLYYFGEVVKGFVELDASVGLTTTALAGEYYFDGSSGARRTGWQNVSVYDSAQSKNISRSRYFDPDMDGRWNKGTADNGDGIALLKVGNDIYRLNSAGHTSGNGEFGDRYKPADAANRFSDGYYTNADGKLLLGWQSATFNGKSQKFYFDKSSGKMIKGIQDIDGKRYYLREASESEYVAGSLCNTAGTITVGSGSGSKTYCINSSGVFQDGWQKLAGAWRFFDSSNYAEEAVETLTAKGANFYKVRSGDYNGAIFYMNNGSSVTKGFKDIKDISGTVNRYYFDDRGVMLTGDFAVKNKCYKADAEGVLYRNRWDGTADSDSTYYYDGNGVRAVGWKGILGKSYYFNTEGKKAKGIISLDNARYFLDKTTGAMVVNDFAIDGADSYYANSRGQLLKGWQKLTVAGGASWFYFDMVTCALRDVKKLNSISGYGDYDDNWYQVDNLIYYMVAGSSLAKGFRTIKNTAGNAAYYYFDADGVLQTGDKSFTDETGFIQAGSSYYRANADGEIYKWAGCVQEKSTFGGYVYYFDGNGKMLTGWVDGSNRYADGKGHIQTGWFNVGSSRYYSQYGEDSDVGGGNYGKVYKDCVQTIDSEIYLFNRSGQMLTGWQTFGGKKYFLENDNKKATYGQAYRGSESAAVKAVGSTNYLFGVDGALIVNSVSGDYNTDKNGVVLTGWRRLLNDGVYKWNYYEAATGKAITGAITEVLAADGRSKWRKLADKWYYFSSDTSLAKGWATGVKGSHDDTASTTGNRFYFDPVTGEMYTGAFAVSGAYYYAGDNGVVYVNKWSDDGSNYYSGDGKRVTGWQNIAGSRYYFNTQGIKVTDVSYVGTTKYLFDTDGKLKNAAGSYVVSGKRYCVDRNGVILTGWRKVDVDGVTDWHYFQTTNGVMSDAGITVVTAYDGKSKWRKLDGEVYYFPSDSSVAYNWQNLKGTMTEPTSGTVNKFYFDPTTGALKVGEFAVGTSYYYADENGVAYVNRWRSVSNETTEIARYYYNNSGVRVSDWQNIYTDKFSGNRKYYFDGDGKLQTGVVTVGGIQYLTASESSDAPKTQKGMLLTGYYGSMDGKGVPSDTTPRYMTNNNGVILKSWQKYDGKWHYMDLTTGIENRNSGTGLAGGTLDATVSTGWFAVAYSAGYSEKYHITSNNLDKGMKTIDGKKYYFDATTGVLKTGRFTVGSQVYYSDDKTGVIAQSDLVKHNGSFLYLNASGVAQKGWITVGSGANAVKYYADLDTGIISTGFRNVSDKMYYFDEGDTAETVGKLYTGFFTVPNRGQSYYDELPGASNMYYADGSGVVVTSGWKNVATSSASDAQKWSYYMAPNLPGVQFGDTMVAGEIVTGNVYIDGAGNVVREEDLPFEVDGRDFATDEETAAYRTAHVDEYYRFDAVTGAREKKVLYFYGNYHGVDVDDNQINTMKSFARFINTDRQFSVESDDLIYVNSDNEDDQERLYKLGLTQYDPKKTTYPKAASSKVTVDDQNYKYVVGNDIAQAGSNGMYAKGSDGHVDVYDEQAYAMDVYDRAIAMYGPNNLVMAGASSGAGTVLSLLLCAARDGKAQPSDTILFSPWVDMAMTGGTKVSSALEHRDVLDTLTYWGARYTRDGNYIHTGKTTPIYRDVKGAGVNYEFASPLYYAPSLYASLKNVYVYTGSGDYCQPATIDMVDKAKAAGADLTLYNYSSQRHGYMFFANNSQMFETIRTACYVVMTQAGVK